jgi:hypothetical protein
VWSDPVTIQLERGPLQRFARAIGETDPRYVDVDQARAAGHPDLPVPLTYLFTLESQVQDTLAFMHALGVDPDAVLHGEQKFSYVEPLHAGQEVQLRTAVVQDTVKADNALRVLVRESQVLQDGRIACRLSSTWLVRLGRAHH